jgi:hypothetical protein
MREENVSSGKVLCLFKTSRNRQMLLAAVIQLEEQNLGTLLRLKAERSLIFLVRTRKPMSTRRTAVPIIEQQFILYLKTLIRNKAPGYCRLE